MKRKYVFRSVMAIIVGLIAFCCINAAVNWNSTIDENVQCFQINVNNGSKPKAVIYEPSSGISEVWKGVCETDIMPRASKVKWTVQHPFQTAVLCISVIVVCIGGGLYLLFLLIIAPLVSLYRWSYDPEYFDYSYIEVYIDFVKHP